MPRKAQTGPEGKKPPAMRDNSPKGRFVPRKSALGGKPESVTRKGSIPAVQPRRKPVLRGVFEV